MTSAFITTTFGEITITLEKITMNSLLSIVGKLDPCFAILDDIRKKLEGFLSKIYESFKRIESSELIGLMSAS